MHHIKKDFSIFNHTLNGKSLHYLDSAATTHKPQAVIDAITTFYTTHNANVGRGIYALAERATQQYEDVRALVARFIGAADPAEIIFTSGTTDSINRVAVMWGMQHINAGDTIVLTELEHHANMVPWQQVAHKKGARIVYIPVLPDGSVDYTNLDTIITSSTKLVAITHTSNALGTQVDLARIVRRAHAVGARVLVDGAQAVVHQAIDVQALDADFFAFSGHKMFGPTGIGVLYAKKELHAALEPSAFGGGMVQIVDWHTATWADSPQKFEAGTPPIAQAIGLGAAITYMQQHIDFNALRAHEAALCAALIAELQKMAQIRILGPIQALSSHGHLVSFVVEGIHAHDVAYACDQYGVSVRAGHHCAQPLAAKMGYGASVRASFAAYNTLEDVAQLCGALRALIKSL